MSGFDLKEGNNRDRSRSPFNRNSGEGRSRSPFNRNGSGGNEAKSRAGSSSPFRTRALRARSTSPYRARIHSFVKDKVMPFVPVITGSSCKKRSSYDRMRRLEGIGGGGCHQGGMRRGTPLKQQLSCRDGGRDDGKLRGSHNSNSSTRATSATSPSLASTSYSETDGSSGLDDSYSESEESYYSSEKEDGSNVSSSYCSSDEDGSYYNSGEEEREVDGDERYFSARSWDEDGNELGADEGKDSRRSSGNDDDESSDADETLEYSVKEGGSNNNFPPPPPRPRANMRKSDDAVKNNGFFEESDDTMVNSDDHKAAQQGVMSHRQLVALLEENEKLRKNMVELKSDFENMLSQMNSLEGADASGGGVGHGDSFSSEGSRVSQCLRRIEEVRDLAGERLDERSRKGKGAKKKEKGAAGKGKGKDGNPLSKVVKDWKEFLNVREREEEKIKKWEASIGKDKKKEMPDDNDASVQTGNISEYVAEANQRMESYQDCVDDLLSENERLCKFYLSPCP